MLLSLKVIFNSKYSPSFLKCNSCQICVYGDYFLTLLDTLLHREFMQTSLSSPEHNALVCWARNWYFKPQEETSEPAKAEHGHWALTARRGCTARQRALLIHAATQSINCPQHTIRTRNAAQNTLNIRNQRTEAFTLFQVKMGEYEI